MSDQREQLNEMKQFMAIAEGKDRPYVCHHNKKGEHECKADSSYGAAKKAAEHWGLKSTAGVSATLTDVKQSTQFVGEDTGLTEINKDTVGSYLSKAAPLAQAGAEAALDAERRGDREEGDALMSKTVKRWHGIERAAAALLNQHGSDPEVAKHIEELKAMIELSRESREQIEYELDEGDNVGGKEFIDDFESKLADNNPCMYCDGEDDNCEVCHGQDEMFEETGSKFRLAEIVGKDGLGELLSDLRTGGIDYLALYFDKLYNHFLDEYPDEIPVGSRTGRPEDPEEYVQDNLERYHQAEIEQYWNTPDMDEDLSEGPGDDTEWDAHWARQDGDDERADDLEADAEWARMDADDEELDEVGEVSFDDYGAAPVYEKAAECDRCFGTGRHPGRPEDCPECHGTGECPKVEEGTFRHEEDSINDQLTSLLRQGKKVISRAAGAVGEVLDIDDRGIATIQHPPETRRGKSVVNFNTFDNIEIVGNVDHYDIVQHWKEADDPIEEDENDDLGVGMKSADYKNVGSKWAVQRSSYPVEYRHEIDPQYRHNEITTVHNSRKEALAQIKAEAQAYIAAFDDPSITHTRGSTEWHGRIPPDPRFREDSFDQKWSLHAVPQQKWIEDDFDESINLESIVESVLEEFPGQPKDYYDDPDDLGPMARGKSDIMKAHGAKDMPMSDFEQDEIDPEIEDEELGYRFD